MLFLTVINLDNTDEQYSNSLKKNLVLTREFFVTSKLNIK